MAHRARNPDLGERIAEHRSQLGLTQTAVAKRAGHVHTDGGVVSQRSAIDLAAPDEDRAVRGRRVSAATHSQRDQPQRKKDAGDRRSSQNGGPEPATLRAFDAICLVVFAHPVPRRS